MFWWVAGTLIATAFDVEWTGRVVLLILSPLWFLVVYVLLVAMLPLTTWLHRRFDILVLVWGLGLAALVDVGRFRYGWDGLGWFNMILVWGLCHQIGFFYDRLVGASRTVAWSLAFGGLFARRPSSSPACTPGRWWGCPASGSPTWPRPPSASRRCSSSRSASPSCCGHGCWSGCAPRQWQRANDDMNRAPCPLYLFHSTGMAVWVVIVYRVVGFNRAFGMVPDVRIDAVWWLSRPLAVLGPLLCTAPMIWVYLRLRGPGLRRTAAPPEPVGRGTQREPGLRAMIVAAGDGGGSGWGCRS